MRIIVQGVPRRRFGEPRKAGNPKHRARGLGVSRNAVSLSVEFCFFGVRGVVTAAPRRVATLLYITRANIFDYPVSVAMSGWLG